MIAKDSFSLTDKDALFPAPLFAMEKLAAGASPATGDWRYLAILPDGSVFADSEGGKSDTAAFCHDCHSANARRDYLFFLPFEFRVSN